MSWEKWKKPAHYKPVLIHFTMSVGVFTVEYIDRKTMKQVRRRFNLNTRRLTKTQKLRAIKQASLWVKYNPR